MLRRSNLTTIFILLFMGILLYSEFLIAAALDASENTQAPEDIMQSAYPNAKLVEELNLSGDTLSEIVGGNPNLSRLKSLVARVYKLADFQWDTDKVDTILKFYEDNLKAQGWQVMMRKIGGMNEATLNLVLQKDGVREGLFVVQLGPKDELVLVKLMGKFSLAAIDDLRAAIRAEWPLRTLRPVAPKFRMPTVIRSSPSQMPTTVLQVSPSKSWMTEGIPSEPVYRDDVEKLEQAIREGNAEADVYVSLGIEYERQNNYEKALEQYRIVLEEFPNASDWVIQRALYAKGKCHEQLGMIEQAKATYAEFIDKFGSNMYFTPVVEMGLIRLQQYDEIVSSEEYENAQHMLWLAENELYNERDYEDAIRGYNFVVGKYPDNPQAASAQLMIGICYGWMRRPEFEIEALETAVAEYPNAAAHYYLGAAYQRQGQYEDAQKQYQTLLDEYPDANRWHRTDTAYNIGVCLEHTDEVDEAIEQYERFMDMYKDDSDQKYLYSSARVALANLKRDADQLPFLGVGLRRIKGEVIVTRVIEGSGAKQAGIRKDDVIFAINGEEVYYPHDVVAVVIKHEIGDTVVVTLMRGYQKLEISATLGKRQTSIPSEQ